jgi:hypothetical protein
MIAKQVSCGQAAKLGIALNQPFALGAFADTRRTDENNASSFLQFVCGSAHVSFSAVRRWVRASSSGFLAVGHKSSESSGAHDYCKEVSAGPKQSH